jgi:hypothetical protein
MALVVFLFTRRVCKNASALVQKQKEEEKKTFPGRDLNP